MKPDPAKEHQFEKSGYCRNCTRPQDTQEACEEAHNWQLCRCGHGYEVHSAIGGQWFEHSGCTCCDCKEFHPGPVTELFLVLCADGQPCTLPDHAGSSWEDHPPGPYLTRKYAEYVMRDLDARRGPYANCDYAACGPHRVGRFIEDK